MTHHLFSNQILENTPETHPDYTNLKLALERAEELCSQVNEGVREKENSDRLEWLQSHVQCEGLAEVTGGWTVAIGPGEAKIYYRSPPTFISQWTYLEPWHRVVGSVTQWLSHRAEPTTTS